jgi:hypothetical protein
MTRQTDHRSAPIRRDSTPDVMQGRVALGPRGAELDPTRGMSAGRSDNAVQDPTRGRSAGRWDNPAHDPTMGRSAAALWAQGPSAPVPASRARSGRR